MPFDLASPEVEELIFTQGGGLSPRALAEENAARKARAVARTAPGRWVIGSDTVVALGDQVYGKPANLDEAAAFLRALSGATHEVITGMCLCFAHDAPEIWSDTTAVTFRTLDGATITRYLAAVPVLDKAGAYALQQHGDWLVEKVEGSPSNVVGLPLESLAARLRQAGFALPGDPGNWRP